jgi:hypothetical protein
MNSPTQRKACKHWAKHIAARVVGTKDKGGMPVPGPTLDHADRLQMHLAVPDVAAEDTRRSPNWSRRLLDPSLRHGRMHIPVDSYMDNAGAAMPRGFRLHGTYVAVVETLDQWHGPVYRYVKVKGDDGGLYILRFDESKAVWDLTLFESERARALRG